MPVLERKNGIRTSEKEKEIPSKFGFGFFANPLGFEKITAKSSSTNFWPQLYRDKQLRAARNVERRSFRLWRLRMLRCEDQDQDGDEVRNHRIEDARLRETHEGFEEGDIGSGKSSNHVG